MDTNSGTLSLTAIARNYHYYAMTRDLKPCSIAYAFCRIYGCNACTRKTCVVFLGPLWDSSTRRDFGSTLQPTAGGEEPVKLGKRGSSSSTLQESTVSLQYLEQEPEEPGQTGPYMLHHTWII